ncbi:hypothetical protein [Cellulomonas bogoriensis]
MASARRKSAAAALAVVGVAGLALASAAQLTIGTASLGAGTQVVASCQPSDGPAIEVGFDSAYQGQGYRTSGVVLDNVAAACDGLDVQVTVATADGTSLHEFTASATEGRTVLTSPSASIPAADIENISVVISG